MDRWLEGQQTFVGRGAVAPGPTNLWWCRCGGSRVNKLVVVHSKPESHFPTFTNVTLAKSLFWRWEKEIRASKLVLVYAQSKVIFLEVRKEILDPRADSK